MTLTQLPRVGEILEDQEAQPDDARFWSVTTIIDQLNKFALVPWAAKQTAIAAVTSQAWHHMPEGDAIKWLTGARFRPPPGSELESATLGTLFHSAAQHLGLWGARPDIVHPEVVPMLDQFERWLNVFQPEFEATELVVYSPSYGYAGTLDAIMTIPEQMYADAVTAVIDYKTGREPLNSKGELKRPYPETGLQIAAYRWAELAAVWRARRYSYYRRRYYLLSPGELALAVPMPEVDMGGCIFVTPESCKLHPMRSDRRIHTYFLHAMEVARFTLKDAKSVVGDPMDPPTPDPNEGLEDPEE